MFEELTIALLIYIHDLCSDEILGNENGSELPWVPDTVKMISIILLTYTPYKLTIINIWGIYICLKLIRLWIYDYVSWIWCLTNNFYINCIMYVDGTIELKQSSDGVLYIEQTMSLYRYQSSAFITWITLWGMCMAMGQQCVPLTCEFAPKELANTL